MKGTRRSASSKPTGRTSSRVKDSLLTAFGRACTAERGQLLLHAAKCSTKAGVDYE